MNHSIAMLDGAIFLRSFAYFIYGVIIIFLRWRGQAWARTKIGAPEWTWQEYENMRVRSFSEDFFNFA